MGFRIHFGFFTCGSVTFTGAIKDQCAWYFAPSEIHRLRFDFSSGLILRWDFGGGISSSLSVEKIRVITSLSSGCPGTIASSPDSAFPRAESWTSRRNPPLRFFASCPWHWKHFSAKIGRISRLNSRGAAYRDVPLSNVTIQRRRQILRGGFMSDEMIFCTGFS